MTPPSPSTPTSILSVRTATPTPTRVTFASQSLYDELDPIWRERLRGQLPRRSSDSESSAYTSSFESESVSSGSCYSVDSSHKTTFEDHSLHEGAVGSEDEDDESLAAHDPLVYPPRDSIEISVNRKRAAAMNRLQAREEPVAHARSFSPLPGLRIVEVIVDVNDSHVPPELAARLSLRVKKKPSALNLLGMRVVSRVKDMVSISAPAKSPRRDAFA
ncbi:hypothetical protein AURDEDRAFT_164052 [Auricularia subglabra TFB-10046 SS5]|nr:hypothetical protein AURDEDRAFT_164052 [Auricularia subglabra TFB-10046 SS5]